MRARLGVYCVLFSAASSALGAVPGDLLPAVSFRDTAGSTWELRRPGHRGAVFITEDAECPVSQRYASRVEEMASRYRAKGFAFYRVDLTPMAEPSKRRPRTAKLVVDRDKAIAIALGAESTAEAFVVDSAGTLRYRGAIDDQYGLDYQRPRASSRWLASAIEKVGAGEEPEVRWTKAHGCPLALRIPAPAQASTTYHNRISRIIQSNCQVCHRIGGLGPMPLETYRQVYDRRAVIETMVSAGRMPPWSAHKGIGEFANDRSLSERDRRDLLDWAKNGAPEGDPRDAPLPRRFASGWNIGKPDYVVSLPEPFRVPAHGEIGYKNFYVKTDLPQDRWVAAIEIKPTQPKVVHHALAFLEEPGRRGLSPEELARLRPGDAIRPQPIDGVREFYAATVPGSLGIVFPVGTGKKLPRGAWIRIEIHYQPNGAEATDRTQIGFRFAPGPVREVESLSAFNTDIVIPPQAPRYEARAEYAFERSGTLISLFPHMHFRGSAFRYDLRYEDGKIEPLLWVPKFDFSWQSYYRLKEPKSVPKGSKLLVTAWFDNSKNNPWNPDSSQTVRWGTRTIDEMLIGYFDFVRD